MAEMTPFEYWDFWDVPLSILLQYRGRNLLLFRWFDDEIDEYSDRYAIYALSDSDFSLFREAGWKLFERKPRRLGDMLVRDVKFDPTRRKELDASILSSFLVQP